RRRLQALAERRDRHVGDQVAVVVAARAPVLIVGVGDRVAVALREQRADPDAPQVVVVGVAGQLLIGEPRGAGEVALVVEPARLARGGGGTAGEPGGGEDGDGDSAAHETPYSMTRPDGQCCSFYDTVRSGRPRVTCHPAVLER